jgi:hypothetical protein
MKEISSQKMMQLCAQTMTLHIVKNEAKVIINLNLSNPLCKK